MADNKESVSDKVKSAVSKTKGEFKDQAGNASDDRNLQKEGKKDKVKGEFQEASGKVKEDR
ncbi:CsbD family protein [Alteribacter natronophilus]|uniref:CsbD family protein n=1 Tax=Alteribacter natronophilus TaxID=2583810 RepID=UPI00110E2086|nr:CsbD family protein [Alteribacter natronophilus]TMW70347.1 CsbD family protein [Alteribacter natronophilus]